MGRAQCFSAAIVVGRWPQITWLTARPGLFIRRGSPVSRLKTLPLPEIHRWPDRASTTAWKQCKSACPGGLQRARRLGRLLQETAFECRQWDAWNVQWCSEEAPGWSGQGACQRNRTIKRARSRLYRPRNSTISLNTQRPAFTSTFLETASSTQQS